VSEGRVEDRMEEIIEDGQSQSQSSRSEDFREADVSTAGARRGRKEGGGERSNSGRGNSQFEARMQAFAHYSLGRLLFPSG
jgi:hypothetical protein